MKTIVLISCVSKKANQCCTAKEMYQSALFKGAFAYWKRLKHQELADECYILSAKYGLLPLDKEICPYDETLKNMGRAKRQEWAENVKKSLEQVADLNNDKFIILAGENYRKYLVNSLGNYVIPLQGKRIGEQLAFYKQQQI